MDNTLAIREHLNCGDWACAHGEAGALQHFAELVARELLDERYAAVARRIACRCQTDLPGATAEWGMLSSVMRSLEATTRADPRH